MITFNSLLMFLLFNILLQITSFTANASSVVTIKLPKTNLVLDATDILKLSNLQLENIDMAQLPGKYKSEQGGSILSLNITKNRKDEWVAERVYSEPSKKNVFKKYKVYKTKFGLADKQGNFLLRKTKEGLIIYESKSELTAIPPSYWIHYIKLN